jgi:hypothetical protein
MNPNIYTFDPATISPFLVGIPKEAIDEVEELGKSFLPNVPDWSDDAPDPWKSLVISDPNAEECHETETEDSTSTF